MARTPVRMLGRAGLLVAATAVGAWVSVPLPGGVFLSGQLVAVLVSGLVLGPWGGAISQAAYLGLGLAGLPVFAAFRAGPAVLMGPTGGYLLGFVPGAMVTGLFAHSTLHRALLAAVVGVVVVHVCGLGGLWWWTGGSVARAVVVGVVPFVVPDLAKAVLAAAVATRIRKVASLRSW